MNKPLRNIVALLALPALGALAGWARAGEELGSGLTAMFVQEAASGADGAGPARREDGYTVEYGGGSVLAALRQRSLGDTGAGMAGPAGRGGTALSASYQPGAVRYALGYAINKNELLPDTRDILLGASTARGPHRWSLALIDRRDGAAAPQHVRLAVIGYTRALSRRTNIYSTYTRLFDGNGAAFTLAGPADIGASPAGLALGLRYRF